MIKKFIIQIEVDEYEIAERVISDIPHSIVGVLRSMKGVVDAKALPRYEEILSKLRRTVNACIDGQQVEIEEDWCKKG
jgi:hypothetical protein